MADNRPTSAKPRDDAKGDVLGVKGEATDFFDLLKRYVLQETVGPLKTIGKTLGLGGAGAILLGTGSVIILVGLLRVFQTEVGSWVTGNLSWVPYALTLASGAAMLGLAALLIVRPPKDASPSEPEVP